MHDKISVELFMPYRKMDIRAGLDIIFVFKNSVLKKSNKVYGEITKKLLDTKCKMGHLGMLPHCTIVYAYHGGNWKIFYRKVGFC